MICLLNVTLKTSTRIWNFHRFPKKRPKGRIKGNKSTKTEREGELLFDHKLRKFYIQKGDEIIGFYDTMTEAFLL
jgi:hypothetical protein